MACRAPRSARLLHHLRSVRESWLLYALDWHELHVRPGGGLADRLGVGGIVFLPLLHERFDRLGRDQLHRVSKASEDTGPMMSSATSLHDHGASFLLLKERDKLAPP